LGEVRLKINRLMDAIEDGRYSAHIKARIDSHEEEERYLIEEIALLEENITPIPEGPIVAIYIGPMMRLFLTHHLIERNLQPVR
jgi:hypothetical protein